MERAKVIGLVFDLPYAPWTDEVLRLRERYDPERVWFPVEITVVGSSGLGPFSPSQTIDYLIAKVGELTRKVARFTCQFSRVESFPASRVYYLALRDEAPFNAVHRSFATSGLRFEPMKFPYKPHCTIAALTPSASDADHMALASFQVPPGKIEVSSMSLYAVDLDRFQCEHLWRVRLGG